LDVEKVLKIALKQLELRLTDAEKREIAALTYEATRRPERQYRSLVLPLLQFEGELFQTLCTAGVPDREDMIDLVFRLFFLKMKLRYQPDTVPPTDFTRTPHGVFYYDSPKK